MINREGIINPHLTLCMYIYVYVYIHIIQCISHLGTGMHNDAHPSMDCAYNFPGALSESLTPESVDPRGHDPGFIWSLYDVMGWLYMTSSIYIYDMYKLWDGFIWSLCLYDMALY